jgi:hypothetical protein
MFNYTYEVTLEGMTIIKRAFSKEQAIILAQAEAIKKGRSYKLIDVKKIVV